MIRSLLGFAALALMAMVVFKLVFGVLGFVFSILITLLWFAAIGFLVYLLLKVISPRTARRVRETVRGRADAA